MPLAHSDIACSGPGIISRLSWLFASLSLSRRGKLPGASNIRVIVAGHRRERFGDEEHIHPIVVVLEYVLNMDQQRPSSLTYMQ